MCGIFGIMTKRDDMPIAQLIREGLQRLDTQAMIVVV